MVTYHFSKEPASSVQISFKHEKKIRESKIFFDLLTNILRSMAKNQGTVILLIDTYKLSISGESH